QDSEIRRVFLEWARSLPLDRRQRAAALEYFERLPVDPNGFHGLAFAENLLIRPRDDNAQGADFNAYVAAPPAGRDKLLDALVQAPPEARKQKKIPEFLLDLKPGDAGRMKPEELERASKQMRLEVRQQLERMLAVMPSEPSKIARIFGHLAFQSGLPLPQRKQTDPPTEFHRTLSFLKDRLRDDAKEREETMNYLERWGVDADRIFGKGEFTWSIWFHVTDPFAMAVIHSIFIVIMVMFALGLFTRVTSVLTWLAALCYIHRSQQVLFGMDTMMNINLIYLMIAPS